MPVRLRIILDNTLEAVAPVGVAINSLCRYWRFSKLHAYQIELCIVEVLTNVVRHAYHDEPGHEIEVRLSLDRDLHFEVRDRGEPIPLERIEAARQLPLADREHLESLPEGGLGLYLLHAVMDEVHYVSTAAGNCLTLVCRLPRKAQETATAEAGKEGAT